MKILQVHNPYTQAGGEDTVVRAEAALLAADGHEVIQWQRPNPTSTPLKIVGLAAAPWNIVSAAAARRETARTMPDVAHVHNTWYELSPAILPAIRSCGVPIVMTLHNYRLTCTNAQLARDGRPCELCVGTHPWHGVRYRCYRDSYASSVAAAATISLNRRLGTWADKVDRFLALTEFARSKLVNGVGIPPEKIVVKPNFTADPGPRPESPSNSDFVLFAGRLSDVKGVATLLEAWRIASPPMRLVIVGDGPLRQALSADLPPGAELRGWMEADEIQKLMHSARALMFPSEWYEGMPMTILEAMASGLPVMASNLGSMIEMIEPLGDRWLVPPGAPLRWAEAMSVLADGAEIDRAGGRARELFEQRYSRGPAIKALLSAYAF